METDIFTHPDFASEKGLALNEINARAKAVEAYLAVLDKAIQKGLELKNVYKRDTDNLLAQKNSYQKDLDILKKDNSAIVTEHKNTIAHLLGEIEIKSHDISNKEERQKVLDTNINTLMLEYRSAEEQLSSLRANVSASERRLKELETRETTLTNSISEKETTLATLTTKYETKQKEHEQLLKDSAILEARKK